MNINKKIISALIIGAVLVGGYYMYSSDKHIGEEKQSTKQDEVSKSDVITKELGDKYQAVTDWDKNLIYTIDAQERLITGKPTLFRGYVNDLFRRNGKIFVQFSSSFFNDVDYVLELECSQQVVNKFFVQKTDDKSFLNLYNEYAIVANIQEVAKPVFALKGSVLSEDEVEIDVESTELFTAKGTCVDIAYLGDDESSKD